MSDVEDVAEDFEPAHGFDYFRTLDDVSQAILHPLRRRAYIEAVRAPVSAKDLSERLDVPLQRMSYHVRLLADAGLLKVVRRTPRRGAIETHYRAVASLELTDEALNSASKETRMRFALAELRTATGDLEHAVAEDGAEREEGYLLARAHFVVDDAGRKRVNELLRDFYLRLSVLEEELRREPGEGVHEMNVVLAQYRGERAAGRNGPILIGMPDEIDTIPP